MGCFRRCGDGGRQLPCKALVVIFYLLFMATTVTARLLANVSRSASSAVQEPSLTDVVAALREITKALNRIVDLLSNNWSWIKVGLLSLGVLFLIEIVKIYTGVYTQYLVDRLREIMSQGNPLAASVNQVASPRTQQAAASNRMATTTADADREGNQNNREVDRLEEGLVADMDYRRKDNAPVLLANLYPLEARTEKGKEALIEERGDYCCVYFEDGKQVP